MRFISIIIFLSLLCGPVLAQQATPVKPAGLDKDEEKRAVVTTAATANKKKAATGTSASTGYWKQQTLSNPQSAQAWLQLALWTWRNNGSPFTTSAVLGDIGGDAGRYINGSGEYELIRFLKSNKTDSAAVYNALQKMTDKATVYPFIIQSDIIRGNSSELKKHCLAFQQLQPLEKNGALYHYHYNVLQSAAAGATIAASGENDLVPLALMQMVHGIRPDITLQYLRPGTLQNNGVYVCLSSGSDLLKTYQNRLAFSGLLAKCIPENTAVTPGLPLVADQLSLGYLEQQVFSGLPATLHNNYLPALLLAYKNYYTGNKLRAEYYKKLILKIAAEGGRLAAVQEQLKEMETNEP
jgi:hypothetical protein